MPKVMVLVAVISVAGGIILASGGSSPQAVLHDGGDARLVGFQPLPDMEGPMCEPEPTLVAGLISPQGAQQAVRRAAPANVPPSADPSGQIAKRQAARIMRTLLDKPGTSLV